MPFETTDIASKVGVPAFDPVKTIGGYADIQNAFNQNKLFQAKSLAGQYLAQATGPDGTPDLGRFSQSIQNDKRTGPFATEILEAAQALHGAGIQNQQGSTNLAASRMDNLRKVAATAGTSSPTGDLEENKRSAIAAITQGVGTLYGPEEAAGFLGNLGDNVRAAVISGAGGPGAQTALTGIPGSVDTGPTNEAVNVNPFTNTRTEMGGDASNIKLGTSPAVLATPINVTDPATGEKHQAILGDYLNPDNTWKEGKTPPLIDAGPLNNTVRATLGAAYGPQIANFEAEVAAAPNTKNLIEQMRNSTSQFATGPNSDFWRKMGELANEYGVKFDPNNVTKTSASEVFNKIVPSLLRQQATMLGMNETDTGRQIAAASIPTNGLTDEGIKKVLSIVEGNTDAIGAQGKVWEKEKARPGGIGNYGNLKMDFSRKVPPSIFQSQYMSLAEIKDLQKGWSPAKIDDWNKRKAIAKEQGWLPNAQ